MDGHNLIGRRNARDAPGPSSGMQDRSTWRTCQQLIIDSNRKFRRLGTSDRDSFFALYRIISARTTSRNFLTISMQGEFRCCGREKVLVREREDYPPLSVARLIFTARIDASIRRGCHRSVHEENSVINNAKCRITKKWVASVSRERYIGDSSQLRKICEFCQAFSRRFVDFKTVLPISQR